MSIKLNNIVKTDTFPDVFVKNAKIKENINVIAKPQSNVSVGSSKQSNTGDVKGK
jgi:hypothetical protein